MTTTSHDTNKNGNLRTSMPSFVDLELKPWHTAHTPRSTPGIFMTFPPSLFLAPHRIPFEARKPASKVTPSAPFAGDFLPPSQRLACTGGIPWAAKDNDFKCDFYIGVIEG